MAEEMRSGQTGEHEESGLLLSVEPLQGTPRRHAKTDDSDGTDGGGLLGDSDGKDGGLLGDSDGSDTSDADGSDTTDVDGSDNVDTDGTDGLVDTDGTDAGADGDGTDGGGLLGDSDGKDTR